ncbi:hypothetical protein [Streptomyces sp. NBC_01304]|uniref:hypothetical protein n=1 Tax=Streptomyces sp. NBC_01304 TaxID=2903818 RepID=UPI002E0DD4B4|nr:hypothetical protein OG430_31350 [Streptomyces sp. NBC_01304]
MAGEEQAQVDPLMAAITGEPVPEEVRGDAGYLAAVADVALLRDQLKAIGDALGEPVPEPKAEPEPEPPKERWLNPVRRRRLFSVALAGAGAAAGVAALVGGVALLGSMQGSGDDATADKGGSKQVVASPSGGDSADAGKQGSGPANSLSPEGWVACSRLMVEGTVVRVAPVEGKRMDRITLKVQRYYKPESGPADVTFPMDWNVDPRLKVGDHTLITIDKGGTQPVNWATGKDLERVRAMLLKALPGAGKITCDTPPGPGD